MKKYLGLRGSALDKAIILLVVWPSFACYSYNLSVIGGVLTLDSFTATFPSIDTINTSGAQQSFNSKIQGTVIALYTIGGIFGSLLCIYFGDRLGRRRVIAGAAAITIVGATLMASAFSLAQLIVARLILGLGTGGYTATVPVWQSEVSRANKRGAFVVIDTIFIGSGISAALFIDLGFFFVKSSSVSWRFPFAFQIVLLLMVMVFILLLPESPRWLVKKGRVDEAREVTAELLDVEPSSEIVDMDIRDIERSLMLSGSQSWWGVFKNGDQRFAHRTVLAASVQLFQQISGINLITTYSTTIFQQYLRLSPIVARVLAACIGFADILGGGIAFLTIDRLGRRVLMIWSAVFLAISMAVLAGTAKADSSTGALVVAVIFIFVFECVFSIGFSGLPYLYAAEIAPLQLRAAINAISTGTLWTFSFLLAEVTPVGLDSISNRYFIIFAVFNAVIALIVYFCFPETKSRTLEEIDEIFLQSKNILDPARVARKLPRVHIADIHDGGKELESVHGDNKG